MDANIRANHSISKMFVSQQMTTATVCWIVFIYMMSVMPTGILRSALSKWIKTCYICITPTITGLHSTTRTLLEKPYAILIVAWSPHMKIYTIFITRLSVGFSVFPHKKTMNVQRSVKITVVEPVARGLKNMIGNVYWMRKEIPVTAKRIAHAILKCVATIIRICYRMVQKPTT